MGTTHDTLSTNPGLVGQLGDLGNQQSWHEFYEIYWRLIFNVALRAGLNQSEAEDVVQETMVSVAKLMPDFKYNPAIGSFRGLLLQITRRRIVDQFRKRKPEICTSDLAGNVGAGTTSHDPLPLAVESELEAIWRAEWEKHLLEKATERVKQRVDPVHYQLYHFFAVQHWSVKEITETMGVSKHLVYKAKERISKSIQKEVKYLEDKII